MESKVLAFMFVYVILFMKEKKIEHEDIQIRDVVLSYESCLLFAIGRNVLKICGKIILYGGMNE